MSTDITKWLEKINLPVHQISETLWVLPLEHDRATYSLSIKIFGDWLTYGAELIPDVEGDNLAQFYRKILEMNSYLNGAHIAKLGDKLALIRHELTIDLDEDRFIRCLAIFNRSHEHVYGHILKEGAELGLKFKP